MNLLDLGNVSTAVITVLLLGSAIDILQAVVFARRGYRRWKRTLINKAKREVLWENYENRKNGKEEG